MSETMTDMPTMVRVNYVTAPPEEANSLDFWIAAHKFAIELLEVNREVFDDEYLTRPSISQWNRTVTFAAYSARELRLWLAMLPQPKRWDKASDGSPKLVATVNGWNLEVCRYDLTCELVETGEYTEVEETEVVEPAKTRKVTRQVPVTVSECPPMMTD